MFVYSAEICTRSGLWSKFIRFTSCDSQDDMSYDLILVLCSGIFNRYSAAHRQIQSQTLVHPTQLQSRFHFNVVLSQIIKTLLKQSIMTEIICTSRLRQNDCCDVQN